MGKTVVDWGAMRPVAGPQGIHCPRITEYFRSIQTEGPLAGTPATFIRFAGCNLECEFCDTEYPSHGLMDGDSAVHIANDGPELVVLTGGEPFIWDIGPIVQRLQAIGKKVQIETNGTIHPDGHFPDGCVIVCSPKTRRVNLEVHGDWYWKLLVDENGILPSTFDPVAAGEADVSNVFLQPLWDSQGAHEKVVELCIKHGYRMSYQWHKVIGIE